MLIWLGTENGVTFYIVMISNAAKAVTDATENSF